MTLTMGTADRQEQDLPSSMVGRMTLILDAFERRGARLTLEEVERSTGLPRSTAHRILGQLVHLGWIEHGTFGYTLGRRALRLAASRGSWDDLRKAATPLLHDLHVLTGFVGHLCVLDGPEIVFLDKIGGAYASTLPSDVGSRWWATNAAIGKVILASLSPERVDDLLRSCPEFSRSADDGFCSIHRELNTIRRAGGLAFERGEGMPGVGAVACAVQGPDGPAGAISLAGDVAQMHFERLVPMVRAAARQASEALATSPDGTAWPQDPPASASPGTAGAAGAAGTGAPGTATARPSAIVGAASAGTGISTGADGEVKGPRLQGSRARLARAYPRGCCGHIHT
ncbi:IclR family transcriptional regulator [Microtetraspora niveoalba]|uniref:IclR family transcriptional regulator n=1 Tax=Microtetraspora niveoalba TaxID=46175 RepID=UPI00082D8CE3|nr:IclR family transcriptional regulator [Microtetraspora niveoalba]